MWLLATLAAGFLAGTLSDRLMSGSGDVKASVSSRVDESLRSDFGRGDSQLLILVLRSASVDKHPAQLSGLLDGLTRRLERQPSVEAALSERDIQDRRLVPKAGTGHLIIITLKTADVLATEQEVPRLRAAVIPTLEAAKAQHNDLIWALTGRAALTYDLTRFDAIDTARAEVRALPLTLFILIFAFGSVVSALIPILLAVASRMIVLGMVFVLAGSVEVSNLVLSIVTMLSIALAIDYSLFLIHRYRQELERIGADFPAIAGCARDELAMRNAMAQSGTAVFYSAATVAIGIGSLIATPIMQTRSVGLGGLFAVLVALVASLTLVPAFLRLVRPRVLEWPRFISRRKSNLSWGWAQWANILEKNPILAIVTCLGVLLALAAPALHTRTGFPESEFLPAELEFSRGMDMLSDMQLKGLVSPIVAVVSDTKQGRALTPERVPALMDFVSRLEKDRRVRIVQGPVQSAATAPGTVEETVGSALARSAFMSHDRNRLLFLIIPAGDSTLFELRELSKEIPAWLKAEGLSVAVGGQAQYYNDFDVAVLASYPITIGLVPWNVGTGPVAILPSAARVGQGHSPQPPFRRGRIRHRRPGFSTRPRFRIVRGRSANQLCAHNRAPGHFLHRVRPEHGL